jgi:hypothetical protein
VKLRRIPKHRSQRGTAVLLALVATIVLAGMAVSMVAVSGAYQHENEGGSNRLRAFYAAEAGVAESVASQRAGVIQDFGSPQDPLPFSGGGYWSSTVDNGDNTTTVTSFATMGGVTAGIEAVVLRQGNGPFANAVFAGNSSDDALYDLTFDGTGARADRINGNVYSGGNIKITGTANVTGSVRAAGVVSGSSASVVGPKLPIPDIPGMHYEINHDFDVASLFSGATYVSSAYGGRAWQLPESNPAHIFRKNPSDRATEIASTTKDDYFLEDPYEAISKSTSLNAANGTHITLAGLPGKPGVSGNDRVYYIDGNLWIHNNNINSFTLFTTGSDYLRATFVVRGNIYFSDNVMYQHDKNDGVAFIAMKSPGEANSGNIYFGDPAFGTLERMDAFMYAENNFYDNNLSAAGSSSVTVNGNMTAGNKVSIKRDFGNLHSKLTVNFDDRLMTGDLHLPGIPKLSGAGSVWNILSWRRISAP